MNLNKFNLINEELKKVISDFQLQGYLSKDKFNILHIKLLKLISYQPYYEDYRIGLINAFNKLLGGDMEFLVNNPASYHMFLWKIHARVIREKEKEKNCRLKLKDIPKEIKVFTKYLPDRQLYLKEGDNYYITTLLGEAAGHISTIKITPQLIEMEYNDHCPSRIMVLHKRLKNKGWNCSDIKTIENIFPEKEGCDNYFFTTKKAIADYKVMEEAKELALELTLGVDIDWITIDILKGFTQEQLDREIELLETAYFFWDNWKIHPKDYLAFLRIIFKYKRKRKKLYRSALN